MSAKIRKNDTVQVIAGRDKGLVGQVIRVQSSKSLVWVKGANIISRHKRGVSGQSESEILRKEAPLHVCKVSLLDPIAKTPTRVGFTFVCDLSEDEKAKLQAQGQEIPMRKVRYSKKNNGQHFV